MHKTLGEIDVLYRQINNLSKMERIEYCESIIDKTQKILSKNPGLLTSKQKEHLSEIISLAQKEIKKLNSTNDNHIKN